jgi:sirohydrochlorin ferrochelatase
MDQELFPALERASYNTLVKAAAKETQPTAAEVAAHVYRRTFAVYTSLFEGLATDKMKQLANEEVQLLGTPFGSGSIFIKGTLWLIWALGRVRRW